MVRNVRAVYPYIALVINSTEMYDFTFCAQFTVKSKFALIPNNITNLIRAYSAFLGLINKRNVYLSVKFIG